MGMFWPMIIEGVYKVGLSLLWYVDFVEWVNVEDTGLKNVLWIIFMSMWHRSLGEEIITGYRTDSNEWILEFPLKGEGC